MGQRRAFNQVLDVLKAALPEAETLRAWGAHRDLLTFARLHNERGDEANRQYPFKPFPEMTRDDMARAGSAIEEMDALLKAAIVFGDVVILVLLQEAFGVPGREMSVTKLSHKRTRQEVRQWASRLNPDALLKAHVLRIYRNRLVLHFERPRTGASIWRTENLKELRLVPIDFSGVTPERHATLERLADKYADLEAVNAVQEVEPGVRNYWDLLEALFYSVPPLIQGEANPDRERVDYELAIGGVKSPTMGAVVSTVELFAAALAQRIEDGDVPPKQGSLQ